MKNLFGILFLVFLGTTIMAQNKTTFVKEIETTILADKFHVKEAISFHIDLSFGGKSSFKGEVISSTNSSWIKVIKDDGTTLIFDGKKAWISPAAKNYKGARFDMFTWQYFFMAPFKFSDGGTKWKELGDQKYTENTLLKSAQLTFESGTGDASNDYYIVYKDQNNLVKAMGYIVTYGGKSIAAAEKNAHAIVYNDYRKVNGIPIAHQWFFHNWSKETGLRDEIGNAKISDVKFLKEKNINHQKTNDAIEVKL